MLVVVTVAGDVVVGGGGGGGGGADGGGGGGGGGGGVVGIGVGLGSEVGGDCAAGLKNPGTTRSDRASSGLAARTCT